MNGIGQLFNETNLNQIRLAQESGEQVIVLADADTVAYAYDEGRFIKSRLIVGEGYTLTAKDIDTLRTHNICLADEL